MSESKSLKKYLNYFTSKISAKILDEKIQTKDDFFKSFDLKPLKDGFLDLKIDSLDKEIVGAKIMKVKNGQIKVDAVMLSEIFLCQKYSREEFRLSFKHRRAGELDEKYQNLSQPHIYVIYSSSHNLENIYLISSAELLRISEIDFSLAIRTIDFLKSCNDNSNSFEIEVTIPLNKIKKSSEVEIVDLEKKIIDASDSEKEEETPEEKGKISKFVLSDFPDDLDLERKLPNRDSNKSKIDSIIYRAFIKIVRSEKRNILQQRDFLSRGVIDIINKKELNSSHAKDKSVLEASLNRLIKLKAVGRPEDNKGYKYLGIKED